MNKKSQAALEFLTSYIWVILGILILIGALSYFGILSPKKLLGDRCNFGSEIGCMNYKIANNGVQLKLKNNVGNAIIVDGIIASTKKVEINCISQMIGSTWEAGDIKDNLIHCDFTDAGLVPGEKEKLNLEITYHTASAGSTFSKSVQGEVFAVAGDKYTETLISEGLIGYWKFDDIADPTPDSSGNGNDGNIEGATWQDTGCINEGCYNFDDSGNYINVGNPAILSLGTSDFTLSAWVKVNGAIGETYYIFNKKIYSNRGYTLYVNVAGKVSLIMEDDDSGGVGVSSSSIINDGKWHLITATIDRDTIGKMYVDGVLKGSQTGITSAEESTIDVSNNFVIGARSDLGGSFFDGSIDEVRIYNKALSEDAIKALYLS